VDGKDGVKDILDLLMDAYGDKNDKKKLKERISSPIFWYVLSILKLTF
jgi:hypothetical protein